SSQRRAGWAAVSGEDLVGSARNPSRQMAKGAMRIGTLKALVPGRYNKAGKAICAMMNHSKKPQRGRALLLAAGSITGLAICLRPSTGTACAMAVWSPVGLRYVVKAASECTAFAILSFLP